jgi:hypothetical protein
MLSIHNIKEYIYIYIYIQHTNIYCKKMRAQFPYNCVHTFIYLVKLMMAYQAKTC